jgi:hypothetical protein
MTSSRSLAFCVSFAVFAAACSGKKSTPDAMPDAMAPAPAVASISPNPLCSDGMTFTIVGSNFAPGATVTIDGMSVQATVVDSMHITVTLPSTVLMNGMNAVVVKNPDGQTASGTLTGEVKPLMFFVDPNVLAANMTARVTVYMSGLTTSVTNVSVQPNGGGSTTQLTAVAAVANHPNQIQATVTGGTLAAGLYDVSVTDGVCSATLPKGLTIVGTPDITITKVDPPFGDPTQATAITITTSGYPLVQTPRVYLSSGGTATSLSAVQFGSTTSVSAILPPNALPAGDYDVIVIDPIDANGGHVGVLSAGFHLIANPPTITSVTPTTVTATVTTGLNVVGSGFATGTTPTAFFTKCSAPVGVVLPTLPFALAPISGATTSAMTVTVNSGSMPASAACTLRIINGTVADANNPCPQGGTCVPFVDFSAIAFVSGSGNLGTWTQSTGTPTDPVLQLPAARTRLGAVAGHVTSQARFLYQVGGDDGTLANASTAVVSTQLDPVGNTLGWTSQRNSLSTARTGAAVIRIGQFIYATGGFNGNATVGSVEAARILDPLDVPPVPTIDLTPSASGVAAGTWVYRVTGVRAANFASDPAGETLPSDPLNVTLPDLTAMTQTPLAKVTLTWPAMQNVASYNVYRTPAAGGDAAGVQLLGNVAQPAGATVTFIDSGLPTTSQTPLPLGATGKWHAVANNLQTARFGATAAIAQGPSNSTTSKIFLYVAGGATDTTLGTGIDNYEWAEVDVAVADGSQVVNAFAIGRNSGNTANQTIGGGRAFAQAFAVDSTLNAAIAAGTTFIYFGSGVGTGPGLASAMDVGSVTTASATGDMGTLATAAASGVGGSAYVPITGFLFALGGINNGATLQNTQSSSMCPDGNGCTSSPPALTTWKNGGGGTPHVQRIFSSALVEGPFIYLFGGSTTAAGTNATQSVERTVF